MAQAVLNANGKVIPRRTIRKLLKNEIHSETEKRKRSIFDDLILKRLGDSTHMFDKSAAPDYVPYSDDVEPALIQLPDDYDPIDGKFSLFEKPIADQSSCFHIHVISFNCIAVPFVI